MFEDSEYEMKKGDTFVTARFCIDDFVETAYFETRSVGTTPFVHIVTET